MLKVGIAGIGFMGWIHWLAYQKTHNARVTAIASRDPIKRSGDWTSIQGNFGPPGEQVDLTGVAAHESVSQLVADDSIDVIDVCLPPSLHTSAVLEALQAGKHVVCEKPLALTTDDCDRMLQAAEQSGGQLLVGHVLPFFLEYDFVRQAIDAGTYGKLLGGEFKRAISDPLWLKDFYDPHKVGGPLVDLHVHDAHFIRMIFGMPDSVISRGRLRGDAVQYCATLFDFADSSYAVSSICSVIDQQGRPFMQGFEIHFEQATLQFEFNAFADGAESVPLKVLTADGQVLRPELGDGDPVQAFVRELQEVVSAVTENQQSKVLNARLARDAIRLCHCQSQSVTTRKPVKV